MGEYFKKFLSPLKYRIHKMIHFLGFVLIPEVPDRPRGNQHKAAI